jgi:5-methylcytosine-specific restriction endonuclease McrA
MLAPLRPCPAKNCRVLTRGGRCPAHVKERHRANDAQRQSSSKRGYNHHWYTVTRPGILTAPPTVYVTPDGIVRGHGPCCVMCLLEDKATPATEVDHIDGHSHNNAPENLRSLCKSHHSSRTAREQGFARVAKQ